MVFQILTRTSWQYCKRKAKEVADDEIYQKADRSDRTDSLDRVLQTEQSIAICNAIRKLGVKHRSVIVLYYYNQMSTKEIAKICECMEGTVKSRLFIARNQLKELLKEQIKEDSEKGEIVEHVEDYIKNQEKIINNEYQSIRYENENKVFVLEKQRVHKKRKKFLSR